MTYVPPPKDLRPLLIFLLAYLAGAGAVIYLLAR